MHTTRMIQTLMAAAAAANLGLANVYFVDRNHPGAADENPGTIEQPWKTLAHAGRTAVAGDQVSIRGGVYRETLEVRNSGLLHQDSPRDLGGRAKRPARIVFEAYEDEAVIIDGSEIIPAGWWEPHAANVYVADLSAPPAEWDRGPLYRGILDVPEGFVFFNDALLHMHQVRNIETGEWRKAVPGPDDAMARHFDPDTQKMYVNLGGADPRREDHRVEVTVRRGGVWAMWTEYITIRRLTVRRGNSVGIEATRTVGLILEDCNIHHVSTGFRAGGDRPIVRRNRIHHTVNRAADFGGSFGALIYGNIVSDFALAGRSYNHYAYMIFGGHNARFLHNIAYQSPSIGHGGGFWPDVACVGHVWRGNAGIRADYYIEAPPLSNLVQWNTALYASIHLRVGRQSTVTENLVAWSPRSGIILGAGSLGNAVTGNWLKQNRVGISAHAEAGRPGVQRKNMAQGNIYEIPDGGFAANWAGHPYRTLEELRATTGQETLGEAREINLDELPLVWVRLDEVEDSHTPFPMFGNPYPSYETLGSYIESVDPWFFWRRGHTEWRGDPERPDLNHGDRIRPRHDARYPGRALAPGTLLSRGPAARQTGLDGYLRLAPVEGTPVRGLAYVATSFSDTAVDAEGFGLWSSSLPVVAGATIDIEFWMGLEDVQPVAESGGAVVFVEWSDWTHQNRSRSYLVGGETAESIANPGLNRGSRDWTPVSGSVTAPQGVKRFALFLGLRSASGRVMYDAIETIRTRPGEPPADVAAEDRKVEDPPLRNAADLHFHIVDLAPFVNRSLEDEEADDGVGGWSDQGAGYDMRGLDTGRLEHEGVPYLILAPESGIVLDARRTRPQSRLPEQVAIPVGQRADLLYFLHSGAWVTPGRTVPVWTYRLEYEDGSSFEIPVRSGVNVRDWSQAGLPYAFLNTEARRARPWPQTVGNSLSPDCGLYVLEHLNPHPERTIESIRFVGDEERFAVPILLGITLGTKP